MRIGIDIDDTITKTSECVQAFKKKHFPMYNPNELLPDAVYENIKFELDDEVHLHAELKEDVIFSLKRLKEMGHEIVFITRRGDISKKAEVNTLSYFKKYAIPYDELVFKCIHKGNIARNLQIDLFIDDNFEMCKEVYQEGIEVIHVSEEDDFLFVCLSDWKEIINYIENRWESGENNNK